MADFLKPFLTLKSSINLKTSLHNNVVIDNTVFKLHYRATAILLFVFTVLVTSRQYIGEHIKCIVGGALNAGVVSSFCFFTATFTVVDHIDQDLVNNGTLPHLGVGPYSAVSDARTIEHTYYQWVPFMLFGQGIMFILTHLLWKKWEGGKIKALLVGLENASFAFSEKEVKGGKGQIPSTDKKRLGVALIRDQFIQHGYIRSTWPTGLVTCEILNVLHVLFQMYITNKFLGGIFWSFGLTLIDDLRTNNEILDTHFPKVTKCSFQKYGPSGSIQMHDVLCVMALNVMNEKIYAMLWFWFVFLFIVSFLNVIWRFITILMHPRSPAFNRYVFAKNVKGRLNTLFGETVADHLAYKDWIFLKYLGKNVDGLLFKEIVDEVTDGIHQHKSFQNPDELCKLHQ